MEKSRLDQLALHCVPGIGSVTIRQLISHFGNATSVWSANKHKVLAIRGVGPIAYALLKNSRDAFSKAEGIAKSLENSGIQIIFHTDHTFPTRLKHIPDAPSILYFEGKCNLNPKRAIAFVGTRKCSEYGLDTVIQLIDQISIFTPLIISGLAYGIDIQSHRQAMHHSLATMAILAGGNNKIYPSEHRHEVKKMLPSGGTLSEHPPGTRPEAHRFPARNRIIAGMSDGVVVVEAAEKGGALITARLANEYNREVMAVPGNRNSSSSKGCHNLIKTNRAHLITSGDDIARLLNWESNEKTPSGPNLELDTAQRRIVTILDDNPDGLNIDRLSWASNLTIHEVALALVNLECHGVIRSLPGQRYKLIRKC